MPPAAKIRTTVKLRQCVYHDLTAYALAAGAAGVSLLSLAQPSEAEVVYTPANQTIDRQGSYKLDLNNDGISDYIIAEHTQHYSNESFQVLSIRNATGNLVNCPSSVCFSGNTYAGALPLGTKIGHTRNLGWLGRDVPMADEILFDNGSVFYFGGWVNVSNRYIGLRFQMNGETHFGWARLNVKFRKGAPKDRTWEAQLTGYAYETIADKAITAGQTKSDAEDVSASPQTQQPKSSLPHPPVAVSSGATSEVFVTSQPEPATLGALSLGSSGLPMWRRHKI